MVKNILLSRMSNMKFDLRRLFWSQLQCKSIDYYQVQVQVGVVALMLSSKAHLSSHSGQL